MLIKIWAALTAALILSACTVTPKTDKPYFNYRPEMVLIVGGTEFKGLATTRLGDSLEIHITSPITLDRVEFSTPGRHEVVRNIDTGWFDSVSKVMTYTFIPTEYEKENHSMLLIQAFSAGAQKAWGAVLFNQDPSPLPGHIDCNGRGTTFAGVSACATKAGLEQKLTFKVPVSFKAGENCIIALSVDRMSALARSGVGWCNAIFSEGTKFHVLTLEGYDEVINY